MLIARSVIIYGHDVRHTGRGTRLWGTGVPVTAPRWFQRSACRPAPAALRHLDRRGQAHCPLTSASFGCSVATHVGTPERDDFCFAHHHAL